METSAVAEIAGRFQRDVLGGMKATFVGKEEVIDLLGLCLIARENLFLLGPPGSAKSALVTDLGSRLHGRVFEYLLTRFTEPNELFGPFDIRKLREGELITNTEGMLPEASIVFLDELLNANSAILNSLLGVLNERIFRRGRETRKLPLLMAVGASNRLPEDEALTALFDRFLLRVRVDNVPGDRLGDVLNAGWKLESAAEPPEPVVSIEELRTVVSALPTVDLSGVRKDLAELVLKIRQTGMPVSDRRAVKLQRLVAASALLMGRRQAAVSDLWVFRYIWDREEQREFLASLVQSVLDKAKQEVAAHPRAIEPNRPDAESLVNDLTSLENALDDPSTTAEEKSRCRDRLGLLAGRLEWIADERQRTWIKERTDALWKRFEETP
jgi:MoxR-like ATPase